MKKLLICIDDTDNLESVGTGELADDMAKTIEKRGWGERTRVTRHQLYVHDDIPYTSHNSSMCFEANIKTEYIDEMTQYFIGYLETKHAPGSDPGLCIVDLTQFSANDELISFGKKAKSQVLTKEDAYEFARKYNIHLSEHGGTGLGVIGALAGCGLRLSGNDGRYRGKEKLEEKYLSVEKLLENPIIDCVQTTDGKQLGADEVVEIHGPLKTVFLNHQSVLLVDPVTDSENSKWITIPKEKLKNY